MRYTRSLLPALCTHQHKSYSSLLLGISSAALFLSTQSDACGILAYVGDEDPALQHLLDALRVLQRSGYDSAGIATIQPGSGISVTKYANGAKDAVERVRIEAPEKHSLHKIGVVHTRWATHGAKTDENAHPILDQKGRIAIVHNGTLENSKGLKDELLKKGVQFATQTDTEVIAQLIGTYLDEGLDLEDAFNKSLARLEGTWGIVMIAKDKPDQLIAARHGSPLVVGVGKDKVFVSSDHTAFSKYTSEYIELKDDEVAVLTSKKVNLDLSRILHFPAVNEADLIPHPYPHWTLREILEEPEAAARALNFGGRLFMGNTVRLGGLDANRDMLLNVQNLIITGQGSSLNAGLYGACLMRWLGSFRTVQTFDASEIGISEFSSPASQTGLLALSQSGETKTVLDSLKVAESVGVPRFSIVNNVGSKVARFTNCGAYVNAGKEHAVISTKGFLSQVIVSGLVASWFAQNREFDAGSNQSRLQRRKQLIDALHRMPIYTGMTLNDRDKIQAIAQKYKDAKHMFVLGKGFSEPIAYEGAQKIKELSYIHAEGYSGGSLKHGPFALIDVGTPIIMLIMDDSHASLMKVAAEEVRARGAKTIIITDNPALVKSVADDLIYIPSNGPLTALLGIIPIQLLAYELAVARGNNPDKPRNLTKTLI
jgi:glucosamine--fructose-6-phosphate aminotransferase (isomerizing)